MSGEVGVDWRTAATASTRAERFPTYAQLILGIAAHDLCHTGQIQLTKRLKVANTQIDRFHDSRRLYG